MNGQRGVAAGIVLGCRPRPTYLDYHVIQHNARGGPNPQTLHVVFFYEVDILCVLYPIAAPERISASSAPR